ncbi:MAG: RNA pseudouridine synthase, partial [Sulfitobacter sp.]
MSHRRITFILGETPPPRLDKALARDVPEEASLSRTRIAKLIDKGMVQVDGAVQLDPRAVVGEGAVIDIDVEEAQDSHILPEDIPLEIVYEDADLVVVNKPAGMVVHPAPGSPSGTLVNALLAHCGDDLSGVGGMKRPGIVHRIDK